MSKRNPEDGISDEEVANYAVCPEAWRLKYIEGARSDRNVPNSSDGTRIRKEWVEEQALSSKLRKYAKVVYLLLVMLVIIVFMLEHKRTLSGQTVRGTQQIQQQAGVNPSLPKLHESYRKSVPTEIVLLLLVLGLLIFMWDLFDRRAANLRQEGGLSKKSEIISARGSPELPARTFRSEALGLIGRPHALIRDGDFIIPVDIQPLTNKVRDRHVLRLYVYLKLIEESEGKRPPYGLLLMGQKKRRVQVANTPEKHRWLESILDEMRSIMDGVPAQPAPSLQKCKHCDVRDRCSHSAYSEQHDL